MAAGARINTFGLVVTGQVRRVHDHETNETTLDVTMEQANEAYEALGRILSFFNGQGVQKARPTDPSVINSGTFAEGMAPAVDTGL